MCQCDPKIKTPWCGKGDCKPPKELTDPAKREEFIKSEVDRIEKAMREALQQQIGKEIFGFKIMVSSEVPVGEVWFIDGYGQKFTIENAVPSIDLKVEIE